MERLLILGQDRDRGVEARAEPVEVRAKQPAPVIADVAELPGERIR
jgi:hypothetical protein